MDLEKAKAATARRSSYVETEMPAALAGVTQDRITELDVRDDLRKGIEPFTRIMQAQAAIPAGSILQVRAIFEPVPLYAVLGKQGFSHWTERLADDDWRIWFYRGDVHVAPSAPQRPVAGAVSGQADDMVVLDVRGLEPPEPMTRTLEALEALPAGKALLQLNARVPQFLLPLLDERGFEYVLVSERPDEVRGLIRRKSNSTKEDSMQDKTTSKELDVRVIPPREKHPAIFQTFDALQPGDDFVLINDHDPFPLRYQFEAERANAFTWEYVESGPVTWRVRIAKTRA